MNQPTTETPTRVVQYAYASGSPQAAAEFRWCPESGVTLTVIDPVEGETARRYYVKGIFFEAERRVVAPSEGAVFMRALVQPSRSSYTRFVDKSEREGLMNRQEARSIAERVLDEEIRSPDGPEIVIVDEFTVESPDTCVFVYNTRAWAETRDDDEVLLGNAPIFIDKATGQTRFGRTDLEIEAQL